MNDANEKKIRFHDSYIFFLFFIFSAILNFLKNPPSVLIQSLLAFLVLLLLTFLMILIKKRQGWKWEGIKWKGLVLFVCMNLGIVFALTVWASEGGGCPPLRSVNLKNLMIYIESGLKYHMKMAAAADRFSMYLFLLGIYYFNTLQIFNFAKFF